MNKELFLTELEERLASLNPADREELLEDYREHFRSGEAEGKSEEEIVLSLGTPKSIAEDIFTQREELLQDPMTPPETYYVPRKPTTKERTPGLRVILLIGLIFLDLILLIPIGISIWSFVISLWILVGTLVLSPVLLLVSLMFGQTLEMYQGFASIAMTGLGLMLLPVILWFTNLVKKLSVLVISWHTYTLKGGR
ncbi:MULTISPECIES: HAAS domain-containing protein [Listeria]|uniref:HAAS signaling domain-containing protein n=1 Tax=Listeria TaxID=1637 RepID=UPI000B590EB6|nr:MULTISPECIES: DUF1700 domain-containing protein [Listeria]